MKNNKLIFLLILLIILSGFGREFIMKNINWVLKYKIHGGGYWAQPIFDGLLNWSVKQITILKWGLTLMFTTYFYFVTYFTIFLLFKIKKFNKIVTKTYLSIFFMSMCLYLIGWSLNIIPLLYDTIRNLMGILQSFIPLMILYLLFKFIPQKKHQ